MITEKLKKKVLQAVEDKKSLDFAKHQAAEVQQTLSTASVVWGRIQQELLNELENTDPSKGCGNRVFFIDGKTYLVISGYGNPKNVDVQELSLEEYKERTTERSLRDSIT
jgi:hypothetical protein